MNYVENNRWFITSSKVKLYMQSKEAYKKVYIDEVDTSFIKESPSLTRGSMIDSFILTPDEFNKDYVIPVWWWKKADLLAECNRQSIPVDKSDKVDDLKAKLYWNRTVVTAWESEMLVWVKRELDRQPLFDMGGKYEAQKEFKVEYKWMMLKGTIDRYGETIRDLKTTKDMKYNSYYEMTEFENMLVNNDMYRYWFQLAWYSLLSYIYTKEWKGGVIDAISPTGNFAYEAYFYPAKVLQQIATSSIIPTLEQLKNDTEKDIFIDDVERNTLVWNRYYPILESAIQNDFKIINTPFYD